MFFEVKHPNVIEAEKTEELLGSLKIKKAALDILSSRCLIAIDESGKIISFAEALEQDSAEVIHFIPLSRKKKTKIKVGFFSTIFSRATWTHPPQLRQTPNMFAVPE